jgi:hypothetical protein
MRIASNRKSPRALIILMLHAFRDDERRRIVVTASGTVSFVDLVTFVERQLLDESWDYSVLHDARHATTNMTPEDSHDAVAHMQRLSQGRPRGPVAIVSADDAFVASARIYAALVTAAGGRMAIFGDIEAGTAWLDEQS